MSFIEHFNVLPDPRADINIKHELLDILFLVVSAVLSGAQGWEDIEIFGHEKLSWLRQYRCFDQGIPSQITLYRVMSLLCADSFNQCFMAWVNEMRMSSGLEVIALDGKTLKSSYQRSEDKLSALHSVCAYATQQGLVLAQSKSKAKKNEVASVLEIIDSLYLKDTVVTADAMSCLTKVTVAIRKQLADYVLQIKSNQAILLREITAYFHKVKRDNPNIIEEHTHMSIDAGHGRIETRQCIALPITDWIAHTAQWQDLNTVIEITRTRDINGEKSTQTAYYISSLSANAEKLNHIIRQHWKIENSLHHVLDVTFNEDNSRIRTKNATENMAMVRRMVTNLIKQTPNLKGSIKNKIKQASWSDETRNLIMFGQKLYEV